MAKGRFPSRNTDKRSRNGYYSFPLVLSEQTWFYEEPKGLLVLHEFRDDKNGILINCNHIPLPWAPLCEAVDNYRRLQRRKKRKAAKRQ